MFLCCAARSVLARYALWQAMGHPVESRLVLVLRFGVCVCMHALPNVGHGGPTLVWGSPMGLQVWFECFVLRNTEALWGSWVVHQDHLMMPMLREGGGCLHRIPRCVSATVMPCRPRHNQACEAMWATVPLAMMFLCLMVCRMQATHVCNVGKWRVGEYGVCRAMLCARCPQMHGVAISRRECRLRHACSWSFAGLALAGPMFCRASQRTASCARGNTQQLVRVAG